MRADQIWTSIWQHENWIEVTREPCPVLGRSMNSVDALASQDERTARLIAGR